MDSERRKRTLQCCQIDGLLTVLLFMGLNNIFEVFNGGKESFLDGGPCASVLSVSLMDC